MTPSSSKYEISYYTELHWSEFLWLFAKKHAKKLCTTCFSHWGHQHIKNLLTFSNYEYENKYLKNEDAKQ